MRLNLVIAAALLVAALAPAGANDNKRQATRAVVAGCQAVVRGDANDNPLQQGYCMGMVQAVAVTNDYAPPTKHFCPFPPTLTVKDYVGAISTNAGKINTQVFDDPVEFITEVLRYSYPCKN